MAYTEKDYEEVNEIVREISSSLAPNENQESQETKQSSGQKLQEYNGSSKIKLLSPWQILQSDKVKIKIHFSSVHVYILITFTR